MRKSEYRNMYEAEDGHWWYVALHDLVLTYVPRRRPRQRILDAGCGTGRLLQLLQLLGAAEGCDASSDALDFCARRGVKAFKADLTVCSFEPAAYDVITSVDVLYHRDVRDDKAALRKLHSALKPGGRLILQAPAYEWLRSRHDDVVHTARRYTRRRVRQMMKSCGFSIEKATYRVTLLFVPIALVRFARKIATHVGNGAGQKSDVKRHSLFLNAVLSTVMKAENILLNYVSLPFGTSVFVVARKPDAQDMIQGSK